MVVFHSHRRFGSFEQFVSRRFKYCSAPGSNCVMTWSLTAHRGLLHPLKLYLAHIAVYMYLKCLTFNTFFACFIANLFLMNVDRCHTANVIICNISANYKGYTNTLLLTVKSSVGFKCSPQLRFLVWKFSRDGLQLNSALSLHITIS